MSINLIAIILIIFVILTFLLAYKLIKSKNALNKNIMKNKRFTHDIRGNIASFRLILYGLREFDQRTKENNTKERNNLFDLLYALEEILQDIEHSFHKWNC
jgi:hypothetical protein